MWIKPVMRVDFVKERPAVAPQRSSFDQPGSMPFDLKTAIAPGEVRYSIRAFVAVTCSALIGIAVVKEKFLMCSRKCG